MVLKRYRILEDGSHEFYTFSSGQKFNVNSWLEDVHSQREVLGQDEQGQDILGDFVVWYRLVGGKYVPDEDKIESIKTEQEQAEFRLERNKELALVDIEINKAEDVGEDTTELRVYRQALRDATIDWVMPSKPEGV